MKLLNREPTEEMLAKVDNALKAERIKTLEDAADRIRKEHTHAHGSKNCGETLSRMANELKEQK